MSGVLPTETEFLVVPDPADRRVGSGGATINALGVMGKDREWWSTHRALLIHSGGDSRRLPQYSPIGKLFGVLPSRTQPKGTTTVFDETMTLSATWAELIPNGLLVASGDVILRFDPNQVKWDRPGVTGVAMRLDLETGSHHGVYVVGEDEQVYTFLQKPTPMEVKAAGGLLDDGRVAVDIGLLRFDAEFTAAMAESGRAQEPAGGRSLRSDHQRVNWTVETGSDSGNFLARTGTGFFASPNGLLRSIARWLKASSFTRGRRARFVRWQLDREEFSIQWFAASARSGTKP